MEKIKWGVLGCAGIAAEQTIPAMQQAENAELYGIASRGLEKAEAFQKRFGFAKAYDSYEALLDDPQVQAVYIPLPTASMASGYGKRRRRESMCFVKSLFLAALRM